MKYDLKFLCATAMLSLCVRTVRAQGVSPRVFVPVLVTNLSGALGSVWQTDLWATNTSDGSVLYRIDPCTLSNCGDTIAPQGTSRRGGYLAAGRWVPLDPAIQLQARFRDLSRNASSAGVELPIIGEAAFRADEINLLAVPRDARFRVTLRVYGFDAAGDVTVELIDSDGQLVRGNQVTLAPPLTDYGLQTSYAQLAIDTSPDATTPMRIRIRTRTSGLRIWALASVTNNATSEVTLIQPWRQ
jgi:hypothetical protein